MAEIFTDEGLNWLLGIVPKGNSNAAPPQTLYLMLFTSQTATTVPAASAVLSTATGVTEAAFTNYARIAIAAADWGATAAGSPDGRQVTSAAKTYAAIGATVGSTLNGYGIATASTAGIGIYYCNFAEGAITPQVGLAVTVTPTMSFGA